MLEVYLNFNGNAREAAAYYAEAFGGEVTAMMNFDQMPKEDQQGMDPMMNNRVVHANVSIFAGQIMMSDTWMGEEATHGNALHILLSHSDHDKIRTVFDNLAKDGQVIQALEPAFFSPLFGQVTDKYGFSWMMMSDQEP